MKKGSPLGVVNPIMAAVAGLGIFAVYRMVTNKKEPQRFIEEPARPEVIIQPTK